MFVLRVVYAGDTWMNLFSHKRNSTDLVAAVLSVTFALPLLSACSGGETGSASQGYKGVINLEGVRLGLPEEGAKGAPLTFALDTNVNMPNFTQYLSRVYDKNNGQYCLVYENGLPMQIRVVYAQTPITKEEALTKLKSIMPAAAPEQTRVDDSQLKSPDKNATMELRYFGDSLKSEIIYTDKTATKVKLVSVANLSKKKDKGGKDAAAAPGATDDKVAGGESKKTE